MIITDALARAFGAPVRKARRGPDLRAGRFCPQHRGPRLLPHLRRRRSLPCDLLAIGVPGSSVGEQALLSHRCTAARSSSATRSALPPSGPLPARRWAPTRPAIRLPASRWRTCSTTSSRTSCPATVCRSWAAPRAPGRPDRARRAGVIAFARQRTSVGPACSLPGTRYGAAAQHRFTRARPRLDSGSSRNDARPRPQSWGRRVAAPAIPTRGESPQPQGTIPARSAYVSLRPSRGGLRSTDPEPYRRWPALRPSGIHVRRLGCLPGGAAEPVRRGSD